jgi:hypothetical protein
MVIINDLLKGGVGMMQKRIGVFMGSLVLIGTILFQGSLILCAQENSASSQIGKRHYFNGCAVEKFNQVKKGLMREDVRKLTGGKEYPAYETNKNGFAFALGEDHSKMQTIEGWAGAPSGELDFFVSDKVALLVYYNEEGLVVTAGKITISSS